MRHLEPKPLFRLLVTVGITAVFISSYGYAQPSESPPPASAPDGFGEEDAEQAKILFKERCAQCHGVQGDGRGPLAKKLDPRPTNLTSSFWFQSTDRKKIKRVILGGGGAIGKSILMPANPDLRTKPKLVAALIEHIIKLAPRPTPQ